VKILTEDVEHEAIQQLVNVAMPVIQMEKIIVTAQREKLYNSTPLLLPHHAIPTFGYWQQIFSW
jgi:hypothetical protein